MDGDIKGIRTCKVISVDDPEGADRIKVRLSPEDNDKTVDDIDYAFPLLPKMFWSKPKVGESVLILLASITDGNSQRYYVGPLISQLHHMDRDLYKDRALSFMRGSDPKLDPNPANDHEKSDGVYPDKDDISIIGRKNCDIQVKTDDIRIRAGVKLMNTSNPYEISFNSTNPAYIKVKKHENELDDSVNSSVSIVADKIALLSHNGLGGFDLTDRNDLITDEQLNGVISDAYKLPYGEKLVEFLKVFVKAFINHTHNYPMLPPNKAYTEDLNTQKTIMLDKEEMLSDTVRIN